MIAGIPNLTALPVILLSAMLQTGYSISLFKAYERGPLSSVYPVARGSAPLFIFGLSYIFFDPIISTETLRWDFCHLLRLGYLWVISVVAKKGRRSGGNSCLIHRAIHCAVFNYRRLWCSHSWKRPVLLRSDGVIQSFVFIVCIWLFWRETFCLVL